MSALPDKSDDVMVKKILTELIMTEEELEEAVIIMKQWLSKRLHLPKAASEDDLLKAFIIGCKSVERAKTKLDKYFTYRLTFKNELFFNRDPIQIKWNKATAISLPLPGRTSEGYKVVMIILPNKEELSNYDNEESAKVSFMVLDLFLRDYPKLPCIIVAFDLTSVTTELVKKYSLSVTSACFKVFLGGYPNRIKRILLFNASPRSQTFFNTLIVPFLGAKLREKIHFHAEDHKCLEKYIPLEMLPSNYEGGKSSSIETLISDIRKRLENERNWFMNEGSQTVNEELRPLDESDVLKGTFRKLQID